MMSEPNPVVALCEAALLQAKLLTLLARPQSRIDAEVAAAFERLSEELRARSFAVLGYEADDLDERRRDRLRIIAADDQYQAASEEFRRQRL